MVDVNPSASGLQAQLQAQLQSGRNARAAKNGLDLTPNPQTIINERIEARQSESDRQAPAQRSARSNDLSSSRDLEEAQTRVSEFDPNRREAPVGRLSLQSGAQRDVPLGQVIDIRV
jgi:hypothetical protein